MIQVQKIYCIYNAEGTLKGELKYIYDKYINNIKCSMCEITHSAISPKKKWKIKCSTYKIKIECLHLDELPKNIKGLVFNKAPCVVGQMDSGIKILIHDKELIKMNGDIDSFFHSLDNKIKIQ